MGYNPNITETMVSILCKKNWSLFIITKLNNKLTKNADIIVVIDAPMNPSQVFFGDILIKGVFPKKKPQI